VYLHGIWIYAQFGPVSISPLYKAVIDRPQAIYSKMRQLR